MTGKTHLQLVGVSKSYGSVRAVETLSLQIQLGECLALLGPSGCGKTTILRSIAGLEKPDQGKILLGERDITNLSPELRNIGLVFQNYALFPHLSVAENVGFGLAARKKPRAEIEEKVNAALGRVRLDGLGKRRVHELSGGQQQRVAIARALAIEPEVLLLDEPLSNLDVSLRAQTGQQLRELIEKLKITTIFVTHDQEDAFALADRIALINQGHLQQVATANQLYFQPDNLFVAQFIGRSNIFSAKLIEQNSNGLYQYLIEDRLKIFVDKKIDKPAVMLQIRPESIKFTDQKDSINCFKANLTNYRFAGTTVHYHLAIEGVKLEAVTLTPRNSASIFDGQYCHIEIPPDSISLFPQ